MNKCWLPLALFVLFAGGIPLPLRAADGEGSTYEQLLREIVNLRLDIAQQRREISALREEVGQMHAKLDNKPYRKVASVPSPANPETYADAKEPVSAAEEAPATPAKIKSTATAKTTMETESAAESAKTAGGSSYKVKSGDTMSSIARSQKISLDALRKANPGIEPKALKVGMDLKLP